MTDIETHINHDTRPIGVFDSGLGGLCAVKEMLKLIPNEDIVYFGDTGRVPYGNRSEELIKKYSMQAIRFLLSHNVKAIVIACGTVSSIALNELKKSFPSVTIIGVVEPSCDEAVKYGDKTIGVLGTAATVTRGAYNKYIIEKKPEYKVISKVCPLFVPIVENGYIGKGNKIAHLAAEEYLEQFRLDGIHTVILGCTHYPMLIDVLVETLPGATFIDSGKCAAYEASKRMYELNIRNSPGHSGKLEIYVSDEVYNFSVTASRFLGVDTTSNIFNIDIEKY